MAHTLSYWNKWSVTLDKQTQETARKEAAMKLHRLEEDGSEGHFEPTERTGGKFLNELNSRGAEWAAKIKIKHVFGVDLKLGPAYGNQDGPDLGEHIQVRSTTVQTGFLPLTALKAHPTHFYVQVVGMFPRFRLTGWMLAAEAIPMDEWFTNEDPVYWQIPQEALHRMEVLPLSDEEINICRKPVDWKQINRILKARLSPYENFDVDNSGNF
jgi:hypothetical protein